MVTKWYSFSVLISCFPECSRVCVMKPFFKSLKHNWCLTHSGQLMYICISNIGYHWFRYWLASCWTPTHYLNQCWHVVNSLSPGKFEWNFVYVIFKRILVIDGCGFCCEIALIWMSLDFTDNQSTLVQVMAWCCQETSHYLSQCWPRSLSPYGITRPQWVNWPLRINWSQNLTIFIHGYEFENAVCKMMAIFFCASLSQSLTSSDIC